MNTSRKQLIGIDYGSKLAGTTVICFVENEQLKLKQSQKKQDADQFLLSEITFLNPEFIFLDAPLSLPGVYRNLEGYSDYFYRQSDKDLKAMSPMFLGGLTARAMRLQAQLKEKNYSVFETYPGYLAQMLSLKEIGYKKEKENIPLVLEQFSNQLPYNLAEIPKNWHQFDAILAFYSGYRYLAGKSESYGRIEEGVIIV